MTNFEMPSGYTARKVDEQTDLTYVGYSKLDEEVDSNEWSILKVTVVGSVTSIGYASGSWNERANLTYR